MSASSPQAAAASNASLAALALLWLLLIGAAPLARLAYEAAGTPALAKLWADAPAWRAAARSLWVAAAAALLAGVLGALLAASLLLRAIPARRSLIFLAILPLLVPPQVLALAAIQAGGPSSPLLLALDLAPPLGTPNPLYGPGGIVLLLGIQGAPLVLLAIAGLLRRLPGEAIAAARGLGATPGQALNRIAWPLLAPGLVAGIGLAYVAALGNFGIAALLGIPGRYQLLPVLLWQRLATGGTTSLGQAAALALLLAGLALPGIAAQVWAARRAPLPSGRPFQPLPLRRAWVASLLLGLYLLVLLGLPLLSLTAAALVPATGVRLTPSTASLANFATALAPGAQTLAALRNSLALSLGAALLLAAASLPIALSLRRRAVRRLAAAADLGYALPGACTAVAAILLALTLPGTGPLYGTMWLILFAYLARFQALALRPLAAAAARLDPALDDAARGLGAGPWRRLASIHAPPLAPALAAAVILVTLLAVNEVTVSALLYGPGAQTLGVLVFNLQDGGSAPLAAAVSCLALLLIAALMGAASLLAGRLPAGTLPWRP